MIFRACGSPVGLQCVIVAFLVHTFYGINIVSSRTMAKIKS